MGWGQWEEGITGTTIRTHGQNQGGGWRWGREVEKMHTSVIE